MIVWEFSGPAASWFISGWCLLRLDHDTGLEKANFQRVEWQSYVRQF